MRKLRLALGAAAFVASGAGLAHSDQGPSDPQIAHIAYTAGQIDVEAARQALQKSRNAEVAPSRRPWFAITRR